MANRIAEGRWQGSTVTRDAAGNILVDGRAVTALVTEYTVINEARKVGSGLGAAAAGTLLLGPIGLAGGLMAARKKRMAIITWDGGMQSLLQVDTPAIHSALLAAAFRNSSRS